MTCEDCNAKFMHNLNIVFHPGGYFCIVCKNCGYEIRLELIIKGEPVEYKLDYPK